MPSRRRLDPASRYIADAWDDARKHDSSLTMGEFARRTFPPMVEQRRGELAAWETREGGRLLGRIIRGDAPGEARQLLDASFDTPIVNVEYRNKSGYVSYSNWLMPPGFSTFDAFRYEHSPDARRVTSLIDKGRVRDSAPFGGQRGGGRITAVRPVKVEQRRPHVGEFRAPS